MAFVYILKCSDNSYYTGSTKNIELRLWQHQNGEGSIHTKKRLPVELVYLEELERVDEAFAREKQIQGWSRNKKEALISGEFNKLHSLSACKNETSSLKIAKHYLQQFPEHHFQQFPERSRRESIEDLVASTPLSQLEPVPEVLEGNSPTDGFESLNHLENQQFPERSRRGCVEDLVASTPLSQLEPVPEVLEGSNNKIINNGTSTPLSDLEESISLNHLEQKGAKPCN